MNESSKQSDIGSLVWDFGVHFKHTVHRDFQMYLPRGMIFLLLSFLNFLPMHIASVVKQNDHS